MTNLTLVIDPVCGMNIDPATAVGSSRFDGETFYFCSRSCETEFDAAPTRYASGKSPAESRHTGPACCGGR